MERIMQKDIRSFFLGNKFISNTTGVADFNYDVIQKNNSQSKTGNNIRAQFILKKMAEASIQIENLDEFLKEIKLIVHELFRSIGFLIIINEKNKGTLPFIINRDDIYLQHKPEFLKIHRKLTCNKIENAEISKDLTKKLFKIKENNESTINVLATLIKNKSAQSIGSLYCFFYKSDYVYDKVDSEYLENTATIIAMFLERLYMEKELKESHHKLSMLKESIIHMLEIAFAVKDPYTAEHQRRVTQLACEIAKRVKPKDQEFLKRIKLAATIHDIGKIYIPSELLTRPGEINEIEKQFINLHAEVGYLILSKEEALLDIAKIVYQHHERIDGSGYPRGITGGQICIEARIIAVADTVEAMNSFRPYREALGMSAAIDEIRREAGKKYDIDVVNICLELIENNNFSFYRV